MIVSKRTPQAKRYNSWRVRILYSIIIGYATFYLCRQNFNIAMPALLEYFNVSKTNFGWILSAASIVYGVGKFCNGFISDQSNARMFVVSGIAISSIITFFSGFVESITLLGVLWIINHWVQSMGWPPIARMLTHWFAPKELATKWAIGTTSIQVGGAVTMILCSYLIENFGWRMAFFVPGIIGFLISIVLFNRLREAPQDVDLPPVEEYKEENNFSYSYTNNMTIKEIFNIVFLNRLMWYVCFTNMCLYIVRLGIIFWAPIFLYELKNMTLSQAGWQVAMYEILGLFGALCSGWLSDKIFKGNRGIVGLIFMVALSLVLTMFWFIPSNYTVFATVMLAWAGFFVYGPQVLLGVASADLSNKKAIGTANGLVSVFASIGSALAGVCVGFIVDITGWGGVFIFFIVSSLLGAFFFAMISKNY